MALPQSFLDELTARNPIVDVVGQYVQLQRRSGRYFGLCPFHNEKTASFSVSPDRNMFYCFGCGKGGSVITFIMEEENLTFIDAVRLLAKRAGMEVPEDSSYDSAYRRVQELQELCAEAARFFHQRLKEPDAAQARAYLNRRGLTGKMVTQFGLGWAPDSWHELTDAMLEKGYTVQDLLDAGLQTRNQEKNTSYDRFRGRLMFPIIDQRGKVVGFGGRVLDDSQPKYLNSPDSSVYNKSRNLFGLNLAKKSRAEQFILCEGYMDVISLHQYGFDSAVASCGTALTSEQAGMLARFEKPVVLLYDSDEAGQKATSRAINILEKTGLDVRVLRLPGAKDPDEYLHTYGSDRFGKLLDGSEDQVIYRLGQLQNQYDLTQDDQKAQFLTQAVSLVAGLNSAVEREIYGGRAAQAAGISTQAMAQEVDKAYNRRRKQAQKKQNEQILNPVASIQPTVKGLTYSDPASAAAEEGLLRLLVLDPGLFDQVTLEPEQFSSELLGRAYAAFRRQSEAGAQVGLTGLEEQFTSQELSHLTRVLTSDGVLSPAALPDYIAVIERRGSRRSLTDDQDLLSLRDRYQQKKGMGG